MSLAANMKLITNSTDTLDNINFDFISAHIYEETSESTTLTTSNEPASAFLSIDCARKDVDHAAQEKTTTSLDLE